MIQTAQPKVKLNGIEYLLLSIQANPGKSQRWHLKRKHLYHHGRPDFHKGGTCSAYFNSPSYRNVLWCDTAHPEVFYYCMHPVDGYVKMNGKQYGGTKSKCAQMHLTRRGWSRANEARWSLGLPGIPFVQH